MKSIKFLFCTILLFFLLPISSHALNLVYSDYDNDEWQIEEVNFDLEDTIPDGWYPLRASSKYLPIDVSWDDENKQVVVYSYDLYSGNSEFRYDRNNLPSEMVIKNGITYCSPKILLSFLEKTVFFYNGEIYCFAGEYIKSNLIDDHDDKEFRKIALATLYAMKISMTEEYEFARTYLTGGIKLIYKNELAYYLPKNTMACVCPSLKQPICKVVYDYINNPFLVRAISHEAYHVYQYRKNGSVDEYLPNKYGDNAVYKFNKIINQI